MRAETTLFRPLALNSKVPSCCFGVYARLCVKSSKMCSEMLISRGGKDVSTLVPCFLTLQIMCLVVSRSRKPFRIEFTLCSSFIIHHNFDTQETHIPLLRPVLLRLFMPDPVAPEFRSKVAEHA